MFRLAVVLEHIGKLAVILGVSMGTSIGWAIYYGEDPVPHIISAAITCVLGAIIYFSFRNDERLNTKEGFALVGLGWVVFSLLGTLPYLFTNTFVTFPDAFFESVSGFTTTGSSVLKDVEIIPKSVLWWRSLTHWLGGMGILMLFVAIIADIGGRANQIFHAEWPGFANEKLTSKAGDSARILWITYMAMSGVLFILLVIGGMPIFDSLCHTFSTMSTGGFSIKNTSLDAYNVFCQWVTIIFMLLSGVNFALHYLAVQSKSLKGYLHSREFMLYSLFIIAATLLILIDHNVGTWDEKWVRTVLFQVVNIMTTTGYVTADYNLWPDASRLILLALMLIGGCAGSTAGGIKVGRVLIMLKQTKIELMKMVHPSAVVPLRVANEVVDKRKLINILQFFFIYILVIILGTIFVSFYNFDIVTSLSAVIASLGNVGAGFNLVGPMSNYSLMPDAVKIFLTLLMLLGRLEIFVLLLLVSPIFWRR